MDAGGDQMNQFAENHLESNGIDVKRSKLEARSEILTWKWILEYPDQLKNHVEMMECRQQRHRCSTSTCTSARRTRIRDASSQQQPAKTKVIGKVVRYTKIHETPIPERLNKDGKLIDTGQIIITQKLQVCNNDINATMVSWRHRVISVEKYITS